MSIVLIVLAVIAGLIALVFIIGLFSKKKYFVERQITINRPANQVFEYTRMLKNQDHFSKWVMMDPAMKKIYKGGEDGNVGFVYEWDSATKQAGAGEQEIKSIIPGERMNAEVRFQRPFKGTSYTSFISKPVSPTQATFVWNIQSEMKYPGNIVLLFLNMDKLLGKDIEESLGTLKYNLERQ